MSSNSDDIQAAGSDTRPPMLDRTDYESWLQRIRLYCKGKENGLQILQSIDQGTFELGTTRDTLRTTPEGGVLLGPEMPRTYEDLSDTEKKRYDADVRATNIVLQGLPKDINKLINHNIEAKSIWDNVKMLLAVHYSKRVRAPPALSPTTEAAIAQWIVPAPPFTLGSSSGSLSPPSSEYSSPSLSGSSSYAPSSPYSGPSHRRSRLSYSSSETSHLSLRSPPHKRHRVLIYSSSSASLSPSPSVEPSRNRCRSPTLPLPLPATAVSTPPIEFLPPHKRFRGTLSAP
ncbi:hypothetical protein Tco_0190815 [Tanacetum coccineum]